MEIIAETCAHDAKLISQLEGELSTLQTKLSREIDVLQTRAEECDISRNAVLTQKDETERLSADLSKLNIILQTKLTSAESLVVELSKQLDVLRSTKNESAARGSVDGVLDEYANYASQVWTDTMHSFTSARYRIVSTGEWAHSSVHTLLTKYDVYQYFALASVFIHTQVLPLLQQYSSWMFKHGSLAVQYSVDAAHSLWREYGSTFYNAHLSKHVASLTTVANKYYKDVYIAKCAPYLDPILIPAFEYTRQKLNYLAYHLTAVLSNDDILLKMYLDFTSLAARCFAYIDSQAIRLSSNHLVIAVFGEYADEVSFTAVYSIVFMFVLVFRSLIIWCIKFAIVLVLFPFKLTLRIVFFLLGFLWPWRKRAPGSIKGARDGSKKMESRQKDVTTLRSSIQTLPGPHSVVDGQGNLIGTPKKGSPTAVLCLVNMMPIEDLRDDKLFNELFEDVHHECGLYGSVREVRIPRPHPRLTYKEEANVKNGIGKVFVHFFELKAAIRAKASLDGRKYDTRVLRASFFPENIFLMKVLLTFLYAYIHTPKVSFLLESCIS